MTRALTPAARVKVIAGVRVEPRIGFGGCDGDRIDVARHDAGSKNLRRRDRQHTGAGAEIEHVEPNAPPLRQIIKRQQTAARGAVMAGAERERRLDLDADGVGFDAGAVMGAVHDKAAGFDRRQAAQALRNPVGLRDRLDAKRRGRRLIGGGWRPARANVVSSGGCSK